MKRLIGIIAVFAIVVVACGDSGGSANSCEGVADDAIDLIQDVLNEMSDLSLEDIAAFGDTPPPALENLETRGNELQEKADDLGCTDTEMQTLVEGRIDSLTADGPFAELILEGIKSDGLFE